MRIIRRKAALAGAASLLGLFAAAPAGAAFPGANGDIAFEGHAITHDNEIFTVNVDGTDQRKLTNNDDDDSDPAFKPSGNQLAFASDRLMPGRGDVFKMNADGSSQGVVDDDRSSDYNPSWSPTGLKIVFASTRAPDGDSDTEIFKMDADGGNVERLTNNTSDDLDPVYSPNGRKIAFERDGRREDAEIFRMNADGDSELQLTENNDWDDDPDWSPDGERIVFESDRDNSPAGPRSTGLMEIYEMRPGGGGEQRLTTNDEQDEDPAYSPNGERIVFASSRENPLYDIFTVGADGDSVRRLTHSNRVLETDPSWGAR